MTPLQQAAQALIEQHLPTYLDRHIAKLRKALDAELQQSVEPAAWMTQDGVACIPLYLHPPQQATVKQYLKVGDSRFESWYSELNQASKGSKQIAREAYEAGLNEADAQQAKQVPTGERAELIAAHQELNTNNYTRDDVEALNDWANRAYDMLARAQQAKQVPMTTDDLYAAYIAAADQMLRAKDERLVFAFARAIEAHHGIGGQP